MSDARMPWFAEAEAMIANLDEHPGMRSARLRALVEVEARWNDAFQTWSPSVGPLPDVIKSWRTRAYAVAQPDWQPARPTRRMPAVSMIVRYWARRDTFKVDVKNPACFRCGRSAPAWENRYFDRAHLVDRCFGGLDHEANLALLCMQCHREMPSFRPTEERAAIEWVRAARSYRSAA